MNNFKVYIVKCVTTDKCYVSYTNVASTTYNPLQYMNKSYLADHTRYTLLGESIATHEMKNHHCRYVKDNLSKEEASSITSKLREKLGARCLNNLPPVINFEAELAMLESL